MTRRRRKRQPLDIREALTIKHDDVFLLCDHHGDVPKQNDDGLGLYFRDTRVLSRYELVVDGDRPVFLHAEADRNYSMVSESTLPVSALDPHGVVVTRNISLLRHRWIECGLRERIRVNNFALTARRLKLEIEFDADFLDLFEVRGMQRDGGAPVERTIGVDAVEMSRAGRDGVTRSVTIGFDPAPRVLRRDRAVFALAVPAQSSVDIHVRVAPCAGEDAPTAQSLETLQADYSSWKRTCTRLAAGGADLQRYLDRAVLDLRMMRGPTGAIDAGIPWFCALFGRDSLIAAYQSLHIRPDLAAATLRTLAAHQGSSLDDAREEEPGKILHELRVGELAGARLVPHTPYFGSVDATLLWLIVYGQTWRWTADRALAEDLWPNALRAVAWLDGFGEGFVEYQRRAPDGLDNQGWKDSFDGILHADGTIAPPPIALVEVQGYAYRARLELARVARDLGHTVFADELEARAGRLRKRFNDEFWDDEHGMYAVALDGSKRRVLSVTSNPGQALWAGIVDEDHASAVVRSLMDRTMCSGWGIRTLATTNPAFDPVGYHTGTVWPHDCGLIADGMKSYGFDIEAATLIDQLAAAAQHFPSGRLPELYCGFAREDVPVPVAYPVACRPQAWATGAVLLMVRTLLGLEADAPNRTLSIVRPELPAWVDHVDLGGLRVGDGFVDVSFYAVEGGTACRVLGKSKDLEVVIRH